MRQSKQVADVLFGGLTLIAIIAMVSFLSEPSKIEIRGENQVRQSLPSATDDILSQLNSDISGPIPAGTNNIGHVEADDFHQGQRAESRLPPTIMYVK